jgi:rhodanese-related sulfurtransferase
MELIERDELKAKIDRGDSFKLVMVLSDFAFQAGHIPGSLNLNSLQDAPRLLNKDDDIVLYCSSVDCMASPTAYRLLTSAGYKHVRRYAGGLLDWTEAGLPLVSLLKLET